MNNINEQQVAQDHAFDHSRLAAFTARYYAEQVGPVPDIRLEVKALQGGLQASVARVRAYIVGQGNRSHIVTFVVKRLEGSQRREAAIYEAVLASTNTAAPRLLDVEQIGPATSYLYLECVNPWRRWPWADTTLAGLVLEQLASVHSSLPVSAVSAVGVGEPLALWDYEAELLYSARATLDVFERSARAEHFTQMRWALPALRRTVEMLPAIRRELLAAQPSCAAIHGDPHPGNAMIRVRNAAKVAILLDWGRARTGSPLEDVSSWLQSLGLWEMEARRRHDSLLQRYLAARGLSTHLGRELRDAYWLAAVSNVLAGALLYHLTLMNRLDAPDRTYAGAARVTRRYLCVIRRADACWRN